MRKNIGYIRTSTATQTNSIETQINMINDYCMKSDITLDEIITDEGLSGKSTKHRNGYMKIIDMIKNDELKTVIVTSLSRFGRSLSQNYNAIKLMQKHNTNFISLKESVDLSTVMGRFVLNIMSSIFEMECELISERTSDILQNKKKNNEVYGVTPFGFNRVKNKLIPNQYEQKVLRKMFRLKDNNQSYQAVADFLNRNNHKTKNGKAYTRYNVFQLMKRDRIFAT